MLIRSEKTFTVRFHSRLAWPLWSVACSGASSPAAAWIRRAVSDLRWSQATGKITGCIGSDRWAEACSLASSTRSFCAWVARANVSIGLYRTARLASIVEKWYEEKYIFRRILNIYPQTGWLKIFILYLNSFQDQNVLKNHLKKKKKNCVLLRFCFFVFKNHKREFFLFVLLLLND